MDARAKGQHPVDVHVGGRIRALRKAAGMSQTELADRIGLTFQQVQKYERGFNRVSASKLYDIATVLRAPLIDLFDGLPGTADESDPHVPVGQMAVIDRLFDTREGSMIARDFPELRPRLRRAVAQLVRTIAAPDE